MAKIKQKVAAPDVRVGQLPKRIFSRYATPRVELPDLIEPQRLSYDWLVKEGIKEILKEYSPISDYSEKKFELSFKKYEIGKPKMTPEEAWTNKRTYEAPMKVTVHVKNKVIGVDKEQDIFFTDIPMMTDQGTFIINGVERVVIPQLARSYGIFFTLNEQKGKHFFGAKVIPARGAWVEIDSDIDGAAYVRVDRKRKFAVTSLLRLFGAETDAEILKLADRANALTGMSKENRDKTRDTLHAMLQTTLEKDTAKTVEESAVEIYKRQRDGDIATPDAAREFIASIFESNRYDLSEIGRHHFNDRFGLAVDKNADNQRVLTIEDVMTILMHIAELNITPGAVADDIDHLGFRRVRFFGEMLQQRIRVGITRMKRNIQDRMSTIDSDTTTPLQFVNPRPLSAVIKEFFNANQLSQLMGQQNLLMEVETLRTVSALGPGGLTRERATIDVRDVHPSHYGRLCPIHTPEGPNIGLILRLSMYARINRFGIIETPYAKVKNGKVTDEVTFMNAHEEEYYTIAHAATEVTDAGKIVRDSVEARRRGEPVLVAREDVDYIDVATNQAFSVATSMVPFVNHDDANRALMGSNMQKQAVPLLVQEAPIVATGIEEAAARDLGRVLIAKEPGEVLKADAKQVVVQNKEGKKTTYPLTQFQRTNDFSAFYHRVVVRPGDKVKRGDVLADTSSTDNGQLALGQNARVAFMSWSGANYEDAIIISERLVKDSKFSTIHMEEFVVAVRDTKLGAEATTPDIPNVSELKLRNLDEEGIVRIGAEVRAGDILVGKVTPKGEQQLSPEERLLRSIFGEKAKDVKDTSLRLDIGKRGRVIGVKVFTRAAGDNVETGVLKRIHITIAQVRNVSVGDKLAGRHGNKGVISRVLPEEDMPYDEDGKPVDILLTPLGVPSRMNLGQILEVHLGMAAHSLDFQAIVPPFGGANENDVKDALKEAGFTEDGKIWLKDGRTGERFAQKTAVGYMYILKLHHMVEDKIHMRSIGPYSLITQQPLGGKAQVGGQRFGEMEVWALLGYGAAYTLREMLTVKSDDIQGRSAAFDAIIHEERMSHPYTPAAFGVLMNQLRGLALDIELRQADGTVERTKVLRKAEAGPKNILDDEEDSDDDEEEITGNDEE